MEFERGVWWNRARHAACAVSCRCRACQVSAAADFDFLHAFSPATNHARKRKRDRLATFVGAVKFFAIFQRATVIDGDSVSGFWIGASAFFDVRDDDARRQCFGISSKRGARSGQGDGGQRASQKLCIHRSYLQVEHTLVRL